MAARSIGSLTVSFGLVAIPVKLYTATQSANAISFNLLHKTCGSRLRQPYICQKEGVVVERDEMVKGYEFAKDQCVRFTPGDQGTRGSRHLGGRLGCDGGRPGLRQDLLSRPGQGRGQPTACWSRRSSRPAAAASATGRRAARPTS